MIDPISFLRRTMTTMLTACIIVTLNTPSFAATKAEESLSLVIDQEDEKLNDGQVGALFDIESINIEIEDKKEELEQNNQDLTKLKQDVSRLYESVKTRICDIYEYGSSVSLLDEYLFDEYIESSKMVTHLEETISQDEDDLEALEESLDEAYSRLRQEIVDYACQFIGNPYVWGGESLTYGCDCSGFIMKVYEHFGVSLPHSSYSFRSVGYGVSSSEIQPGDIVCYDGHCAIYIGEGKIVHASNAREGIKISSDYNYRTVIAIRRIF